MWIVVLDILLPILIAVVKWLTGLTSKAELSPALIEKLKQLRTMCTAVGNRCSELDISYAPVQESAEAPHAPPTDVPSMRAALASGVDRLGQLPRLLVWQADRDLIAGVGTYFATALDPEIQRLIDVTPKT